ncbi:Uncharacterized protein FKW44_022104, partial [Caligus rogercresseyi]
YDRQGEPHQRLQDSRFCHNSDSLRLSVDEMCSEVDELAEMSLHAGEQLLVILGVCCLCFFLYMRFVAATEDFGYVLTCILISFLYFIDRSMECYTAS